MDLLSVLFIGELFSDLNLALKIFALLAVVSFVMSHLGKTPLAFALIGGISWFVLFDYWVFFGGVFVLYTLMTLGVTGILVDFFFVSQMSGEGGAPSPVDSAQDLAQRQQQMKRANQAMARMGGNAVAAKVPGGGAPSGAGGPGGGARPMHKPGGHMKRPGG